MRLSDVNLSRLEGGFCMIRRIFAALFCAVVFGLFADARPAQAQEAYGRQWVSSYSTQDWDRFYHYPYVYYPQNFWGDEYYRSSESLYYRYPPEMRIPVYNKQWHNEYPQSAQWNKWMHYNERSRPGAVPLGPPLDSGHVLSPHATASDEKRDSKPASRLRFSRLFYLPLSRST